MANKKGITYYKLESTYDGDKTKYCGLTGAEIDSNFHYLRGQELESLTYDKETGTLTLTKLNGKKLVAEGIKHEIKEIISGSTSDISMEGTYFDSENATLHLVINGTEFDVDGFEVKSNNKVYTNGTLVGDGTKTNVLGISGTNTTGFYSPAKGYVDITSGQTLPLTAIKGDIYVTKENIGKYGLLYNYQAVLAIEKALEGTQWHVPTLSEWSSMLDAIEDQTCEEVITHYSDKSNIDLGEYAGLYLKSKDGSWKIEEDEYDRIDDYGFSAYPSGYADEWGETHNFGKKAIFWTSTVHEDNTDVWTKGLDYNKDTVHQQAESTSVALSLRLVRDYNDNYEEVETISGVPYNCILMPYKDNEGNTGSRIWTAQNVTFSSLLERVEDYPKAKAYNVTDSEGEILGNEDVYFLNYWDGKEWIKKEIKENEVIPIAIGPDGSEDEDWVLKDGELQKQSDIYSESVVEEFDIKLSAFTENINKEIDDLKKSKFDTDNIIPKTYQLYVTEGVTLLTEKGNEIKILFDGNYGEFSGSTRQHVDCTKITLAESVVELNDGETYQISYTLTPVNTDDTPVFESTNEKVVTVSKLGGKVVYQGEGIANVNVTCGSVTATTIFSCAKPKEIDCTGLTLAEYTKDLYVEDTYQITAITEPSDTTYDVLYSVNPDSEDIVSVDETGFVTCTSAGTGVITVKCHNQSKTITFTCKEHEIVIPCTGLSVTPTSVTINVGDFYNISPDVSPENTTDKLVFEIADSDILKKVSEKDGICRVSGATSGTTTVTVTCGEDHSVDVLFTVKATEEHCTDITLGVTEISMNSIGQVVDINAQKVPTGSVEELTYKSDDESVATVDENGSVTCSGQGTTNITVTCGDITKTVPVTFIPCSSMTVSEAPTSLTVGDTFQIDVELTPEDTTQDITYSSSDDKVASVDSDGEVTINDYGDATITVECGDASDEVEISVEEPVTEKFYYGFCRKSKVLNHELDDIFTDTGATITGVSFETGNTYDIVYDITDFTPEEEIDYDDDEPYRISSILLVPVGITRKIYRKTTSGKGNEVTYPTSINGSEYIISYNGVDYQVGYVDRGPLSEKTSIEEIIDILI